MNETSTPTVEPTGELLRQVAELGRDDVARCYQCRKCTNGCPMTFAMDVMPNQVMRLVQMGLTDEALRSKTVWVCVACETCTTRCPNDIDIAGVMDALRKLATDADISDGDAHIPVFHRKFLKSIRRRGRVFELGLVSGYKFGSGDLWTDMKLGLKMMAKGRLPLLPHRVKARGEIKAIFRKEKA